jgi:hypothetical protein
MSQYIRIYSLQRSYKEPIIAIYMSMNFLVVSVLYTKFWLTSVVIVFYFCFHKYVIYRSRDRSVGVTIELGLDCRGSILGRDKRFTFFEAGSQAHPASYLTDPGDCILGGETAGTWSWSHTSIHCGGQEWWSYNSTSPCVSMEWFLIN